MDSFYHSFVTDLFQLLHRFFHRLKRLFNLRNESDLLRKFPPIAKKSSFLIWALTQRIQQANGLGITTPSTISFL